MSRSVVVAVTTMSVALAVLLGGARRVAAAPILYAVTFDEELLTINPATGAGTLIGKLGPTNVDAMGLDAYNGELMILDQIQDQLLVVNPLTAGTVRTQAVIDTFGGAGVFSEGDFVIRKSDGAAFYCESDFRFLGLNLTTGVANQINGGFPDNMDGLAFQPGTGTLFAWQTGG